METEAYTISEYLTGISDLLTEKGLKKVLSKRRLAPDTPVDDLDERDLDLAEAEVYYWLTNLPVGGSVEKIADGNFSYSDGGWQVSGANIDEWRRKYTALRSKWNEEAVLKSKIRIINL
ncbi:MAG: hypothetical protein NC311_07630 [Muribaculaceae bacterium]|nr:hypothetical protein [Muribaculaceae bacterium]